MKRPLYKYLSDPYTKTWLHHIFLNAHVYQFGWMQIITGGPRAGKSMTEATIADLLSRKGITEANIGFTPREYLQSLDEIKPGEPVLWSELGTALSARKWYSFSNILTTEVIQTMMIKKPIVLMDTIDLSFIDIQARKMIYAYAEAKRWENNPVDLRVFRISVNRRSGDIYFPHPLVKVNGSICKLIKVRIKQQPDEEVWRYYDKRQREYKDKIRKRSIKMLQLFDKDTGEAETETIYDLINKVSADKTNYVNAKGKLDWILIKHGLKISEPKAKEIKKVLEMKNKTVDMSERHDTTI